MCPLSERWLRWKRSICIRIDWVASGTHCSVGSRIWMRLNWAVIIRGIFLGIVWRALLVWGRFTWRGTGWKRWVQWFSEGVKSWRRLSLVRIGWVCWRRVLFVGWSIWRLHLFSGHRLRKKQNVYSLTPSTTFIQNLVIRTKFAYFRTFYNTYIHVSVRKKYTVIWKRLIRNLCNSIHYNSIHPMKIGRLFILQ